MIQFVETIGFYWSERKITFWLKGVSKKQFVKLEGKLVTKLADRRRKDDRIHSLKCIFIGLGFLFRDMFRKDRTKRQGFVCVRCGRMFPTKKEVKK